jgi:hypothetical protein
LELFLGGQDPEAKSVRIFAQSPSASLGLLLVSVELGCSQIRRVLRLGRGRSGVDAVVLMGRFILTMDKTLGEL